MKRAMITGVFGQDGSFLAEFLVRNGYEVFGLCRNNSGLQPLRHIPIYNHINLIHCDLLDRELLNKIIGDLSPHEIYNLASQSLPSLSWADPKQTIEPNCIGAVNIFEAVRAYSPETRVYQASSSEMFGESEELAHDENSVFNPKNPYAATKVFSHQMAKIYREAYGLFIANGILFNHESERRPFHFVTQKVAYGAACASLGLTNSPDLTEDGVPIFVNNTLPMGNLEIYRDWGFAGDYVEAMQLMLQQDEPDDFIIATGELHSIGDLCQTAFACAGKDWRDYVVNDSKFTRPSDATKSHASISKAKNQLGWSPRLRFGGLVERMVVAQINRLKDKLANSNVVPKQG